MMPSGLWIVTRARVVFPTESVAVTLTAWGPSDHVVVSMSYGDDKEPEVVPSRVYVTDARSVSTTSRSMRRPGTMIAPLGGETREIRGPSLGGTTRSCRDQ